MYNKNYYTNIVAGGNYTLDNEIIGVREMYLNEAKKYGEVNSLLDIGCALGYFLLIAKNNDVKELYGVDISSFAIEELIKKKITQNCKVINLIEHPLSTNKKFDLISLLDVVEHISNNNLIKLFKNIEKNIGKETKILIVTPNHNLLRKVLFSFMFKEDPTHINLKNSNQWVSFLRQKFDFIEKKDIILSSSIPTRYVRKKLNIKKFNPIFGIGSLALRSIIVLKKKSN